MLAAVPLGLILVCTAIGWLCGRPVVGLVVGLVLALLGAGTAAS
jgi:hypothetical protein